MPRAPNTTRIVIANSNVPNMVGQISTALARAGLNIADLLNKSRGEVAYTLIGGQGWVLPGRSGLGHRADRKTRKDTAQNRDKCFY